MEHIKHELWDDRTLRSIRPGKINTIMVKDEENKQDEGMSIMIERWE